MKHKEAKEFVDQYILLCDKFKAEVLINNHGVHCIQFDDGESVPFAVVYPAWNEEVK